MDLVVYGTATCPPCKKIKQYLNNYSIEHSFVLISKDYNPHNFRTVPVVCLEKDGVIQEKFTGFDLERLKQFIEKLG